MPDDNSQANAVQTEEQAAIEEMQRAFKTTPLEGDKEETNSTPDEAQEQEQQAQEQEQQEQQPDHADQPQEADEQPPESGDDEPDSPEVHKLQSWLGRKQAKWADEQEARLKAILDGYFKPVEQTNTQPDSFTLELPDIGEDLEEPVTTKAEVLELLEKTNKAKERKQTEYWATYGKNLGQLAAADKLDPDTIDKVAAELDQGLGNPIVHNDPVINARLNYQQALINVLKSSPAKPVGKAVPVKGEAPSSATGVITPQKTEAEPQPVVNLDAESKRLAEAFGLSDEFIKKAVKKKK